MTRTRSTAVERAAWLDEMRADCPPGTELTTVLRHVSASGMTRDIDVFRFGIEGGEITRYWLSYRVAAILGETMAHDAVRVGGAGMDMGFHLVYSLSSRLYPDGFECVGEECPSNDHGNGEPRPHEYAPGDTNPADDPGCAVYHCGRSRYQHPTLPAHHRDGGYALRQRWL